MNTLNNQIRNAPLWCWTSRDDLKSQTSYDAINNATAIWACALWKRFVYAHGWCWPHCFFMKTLNCIFTTCCGEQTKDAGDMQIIPQCDAGVINIHFNSALLLQIDHHIICNSSICMIQRSHNNSLQRRYRLYTSWSVWQDFLWLDNKINPDLWTLTFSLKAQRHVCRRERRLHIFIKLRISLIISMASVVSHRRATLINTQQMNTQIDTHHMSGKSMWWSTFHRQRDY